MLEQIKKNVITAVLVTVILGLGTAVLTTIKGGWLVGVLGGVTERELHELVDNRITALSAGENAPLASRSDLDDLTRRLEAATKEAKMAVETANGYVETLEAVKNGISDLQNHFDGAARIIYFSDRYTICANAGCSAGSQSSTDSSNVLQLNATGTRVLDIEVSDSHEIAEPFYIIVAWYDIVDNEFVASDGTSVDPIVELNNSDTDLSVIIDVGEFSSKAYMRLELHFLVAIKNAIRTRT